MKSNMSKGNYDDFMMTVERDFYNSDLNKIVDRNILLNIAMDLGLDDDHPGSFGRKEGFFHSPIGKMKPYDRRDSYPHSPFKMIKSPGLYFG